MLTNNKYLEFYRSVLFGKDYIDYIKSGSVDDIYKCCFNKAWTTVARTWKGAKPKSKIFSIVKGYVTKSISNIRDLIKELSTDLTIGQSQKVVNMFLKYLCTFDDLWPKLKYEFEIFDCPIDNYILKNIKKGLTVTVN